MTLSDLLMPTYAQMLSALSLWLTKADTQRPAGNAEPLLAVRLAPDMFPLATQVRFACWKAQEGVYRLLQQDFPPSVHTLFDEGRNGGDRPGTLADAQARIAETLAVIEATGSIAIDPASPIAHTLPVVAP